MRFHGPSYIARAKLGCRGLSPSHFCRFVGGLSALHIYFSSRNMTTYEHFRHRDSANPYNLGVWRNCGEVFCTRIPTMAQERALPGHVPKPGVDLCTCSSWS